MKTKTRCLLATLVVLGMCLLGVVIYFHYYTIGHVSWFKFPSSQSRPMVEFVYYKDKMLYFGVFEQAVDINLNRENLIVVNNLSREISYDTKRKQFVPNEQQSDYKYVSKRMNHRDNAYIMDYYNVTKPEEAIEWRGRIFWEY